MKNVIDVSPEMFHRLSALHLSRLTPQISKETAEYIKDNAENKVEEPPSAMEKVEDVKTVESQIPQSNNNKEKIELPDDVKEALRRLHKAVVRRLNSRGEIMHGPNGVKYIRIADLDLIGVDIPTLLNAAKALGIVNLISIADYGRNKVVYARVDGLLQLAEILKEL